MFSSNQVFCVSCASEQLQDVLALALKMYFGSNGWRRLCCQMTNGGKFVIGTHNGTPYPGWDRMIFDEPSLELITSALKQFALEHPAPAIEEGEGMYEDGFTVEACTDTSLVDDGEIRNPYGAIVTVRAYKCFYSK